MANITLYHRCLRTLAAMEDRIQIQASDDSYTKFSNRIEAAKQEVQQRSSRIRDASAPGVRVTSTTVSRRLSHAPTSFAASVASDGPPSAPLPTSHPLLDRSGMRVANFKRPVTSGSVGRKASAAAVAATGTAAGPHNITPHFPVNAGVTHNPELMRRPLKDRIIHLLAVRPYKKPELFARLSKEGIRDRDKKLIITIVLQVSVMRDNTFHLLRHIWNDVSEDWPFYTEQERQAFKRRKPQNLTPPCSDGSNYSSGRSPASSTASPAHSVQHVTDSPLGVSLGGEGGISVGGSTSRLPYVSFVAPATTSAYGHSDVTTGRMGGSGGASGVGLAASAHIRSGDGANCLSDSDDDDDESVKRQGYNAASNFDGCQDAHVDDGLAEENADEQEFHDYSSLDRPLSYCPRDEDLSQAVPATAYTRDCDIDAPVIATVAEPVETMCASKKRRISHMAPSAVSIDATPGLSSPTKADDGRKRRHKVVHESTAPSAVAGGAQVITSRGSDGRCAAITSPAMRAEYKTLFNSKYEAYRQLHARVSTSSQKFMRWQNELTKLDPTSRRHKHVKDKIVREYQALKGDKTEFEALHAELARVKQLVADYDSRVLGRVGGGGAVRADAI